VVKFVGAKVAQTVGPRGVCPLCQTVWAPPPFLLPTRWLWFFFIFRCHFLVLFLGRHKKTPTEPHITFSGFFWGFLLDECQFRIPERAAYRGVRGLEYLFVDRRPRANVAPAPTSSWVLCWPGRSSSVSGFGQGFFLRLGAPGGGAGGGRGGLVGPQRLPPPGEGTPVVLGPALVSSILGKCFILSFFDPLRSPRTHRSFPGSPPTLGRWVRPPSPSGA